MLPCGFCGRRGCAITLVKTSSAFKPQSSCTFFHAFQLGTAQKYSKTSPCTNVPIICTLCPQQDKAKTFTAIWKYNMMEHIKSHHPTFASPGVTLPQELFQKLVISNEEQSQMKIPQAFISNLMLQTPDGTTVSAPGPSRRGKRKVAEPCDGGAPLAKRKR